MEQHYGGALEHADSSSIATFTALYKRLLHGDEASDKSDESSTDFIDILSNMNS